MRGHRCREIGHRVRRTSIPESQRDGRGTECLRERDEVEISDHRAEGICTLSWADELRLYQCYWRNSLHRSTIEVNSVCSVQPSDALWTRNEVASQTVGITG